tara:strand:+ start:290 stop:1063 length:774 start_codon:yes stop_codon:yes gene_type:complete
MKRLFNIFTLSLSLVFAQDAASVASVQFDGTGLSDLETKTIYDYFMGELKNASDDPIQDQEAVDRAVAALDLVTTDCYKKDCLMAAQEAVASNVFLAGVLTFAKNKYRVKVYKMDTSRPGKVKSYKIRYKGDTDGFITELEILAWKIMGKEVPGRLNDKRKPNQESFFEQVAENPWVQRGAVVAVAGLGASSYLKNTAGAAKSQDRIDYLKKNDPNNPGIASHESSRDGAKSTAMLSLGLTVGSLAYGYFTGVFSEE